VNRFFDFSAHQLKLVVLLAGILMIFSTYRLIRSFSSADQQSLKLVFQAGGHDLSYDPVLKVDINHTPADSLELVPGIGPVFASRIVTFRDSAGGFRKTEDIMLVEGIGIKTYERIKDYLEVNPW